MWQCEFEELLNQMATKVQAASTSGVRLLKKTTGVVNTLDHRLIINQNDFTDLIWYCYFRHSLKQLKYLFHISY